MLRVMQPLSKLVGAGLRSALVLVLVFAALPASARQQPSGGTLRGTVTDEFGGVVVGATVTLVS